MVLDTIKDKEQILDDAKLLWSYAKHHKKQAMRYADFRNHFAKVEKIRITHERLMAAIDHLINEGLFTQVAPDAWRVQKQIQHSRQHQETLEALRSSIHDDEGEEVKAPVMEERIIPSVVKREIKLSEENTILAQALDFVKEFPGTVSNDLIQYFGIPSNRATAMLNGLVQRKVVKRHQEEREIGKSTKGNPVRRKVWVYYPLEPVRNLVSSQTSPPPQPQRRADDLRTNVHVTISFTAASASIATMFYSYIKANGGADLSMEVKDA